MAALFKRANTDFLTLAQTGRSRYLRTRARV
jgi:hypothetical protein